MSKEFEKHNPNNSDCPITRQISIATCTCPEQKEEWESLYECPNTGCDNNGTIAVQISECEFEPEQCQYCYEMWFPLRDAIRSQIALAEERGRRDAVEKATAKVMAMRMG